MNNLYSLDEIRRAKAAEENLMAVRARARRTQWRVIAGAVGLGLMAWLILWLVG